MLEQLYNILTYTLIILMQPIIYRLLIIIYIIGCVDAHCQQQFQDDNGTCIKQISQCSAFCTSCYIKEDSPTKLQCKSCQPGYFLTLLTNTTKTLCWTYFNECFACPKLCTSCSNQNNCLSCQSSAFLSTTNNLCVKCVDCLTCNQFGCLSCLNGYQLFNKKCLKCSYPCQLCNGSLAIVNSVINTSYVFTSCVKCSIPFNLQPILGKCIRCKVEKCKDCTKDIQICLQCHNSYKLQSNQCLFICPPNCLSCLNSTICLQCKKQYILDYSQQCFKEKPNLIIIQSQNVGAVRDGTKVILCPLGCQICSQNRSCTKPSRGFSILQQKVERCSNYCKTCSSYNSSLLICTQCSNRYHLNVNTFLCEQCPSNCLQCNNQLKCVKCGLKYYVSEGKCLSCINHCDICFNDTSCIECSWGYTSYNFSQCVQCVLQCTKCSHQNLSMCLECREGYYLSINKCIPCQKGCLRCSSSECFQCFAGFSLQNGKCSNQCQFPCLTCSSFNNYSYCLSCYQGYYISKIGDNQNCLAVEVCTSAQCTHCAVGYYKQFHQCLKCYNDKCGQCLPGALNCTNCLTGWFLNNFECLKCGDECKSCLNQHLCLICKEGYTFLRDPNVYINGIANLLVNNRQDICLKCQNPCQTCFGLPTICSSCVQSFYFFESKCISDCNMTIEIIFSIDLPIFYDKITQVKKQLILFSGNNTVIQNISTIQMKSGSSIITIIFSLPNQSAHTAQTLTKNIKLTNSVAGLPLQKFSILSIFETDFSTSSIADKPLGIFLGILLPFGIGVLLIILCIILKVRNKKNQNIKVIHKIHVFDVDPNSQQSGQNQVFDPNSLYGQFQL